MAEEQSKNERPLVERWLEDQQEWQKTMLRYMDTMANNEEFLVHLGNAMRGSLLAGKPYPGTEPAGPPPVASADSDNDHTADAVPADDRLDRILFALHEIQGQLNDLHLTVERLAATIDGAQDAGGASDNNNDADVTQAEPESNSVKASLHDRSARSRHSRTLESSTAQPKMRRSRPRSSYGRRGDSD